MGTAGCNECVAGFIKFHSSGSSQMYFSRKVMGPSLGPPFSHLIKII